MSGHSHFKSIKRTKEAEDQRRGKIFSKLSRAISLAAREGGDPKTNSKLRFIIEEAKRENLPKENIERAIKRGTGQLPGEKLEEVLYEAYGPGGIAIIIETITDNRNRTLAEIKHILNQYGGKLAGPGSVKWLFERKGCITIDAAAQASEDNKEEKAKPQNKENLEMAAIEAGAQDIYWQGDTLEVYTKPEEIGKVKENLEKRKIHIASASLDWVAKNEVEIGANQRKACQSLFEALDELDSVKDIYSNLKYVSN